MLDLFYKPTRIKDAIVFDPFMGSGTTLGESLKLGMRVAGKDINPVAYFLVRNALAVHDRQAIVQTYREIERDVASQIRRYYQTVTPDGQVADVLYYFWVKIVNCPECSSTVDLFASYIFAKHAYPRKYPRAQALCPRCGSINEVHYAARAARCSSCKLVFDPRSGPVRGHKAECPDCKSQFPIARTIRLTDNPPDHRLYAKLVLMPNKTKAYLPATEEDRELYRDAVTSLEKKDDGYPVVRIDPGYNTDQALGYNYRYWHQMFNARQLLCLSILAARIKEIPDQVRRDLFVCLFSGSLEFNNMFASYKGEGTGAVRHMFAHHILKPERTPLEANVWGTPKSSGSFSTLFTTRICRALDHALEPFELRIGKVNGRMEKEKVFGLSEKIGYRAATSYKEFETGKRLYISCGD